ncbi:acetyltransferase [Leptomonas pyrrhocoris]|uniref:Acetyltransferase n=1 Tax=Leptomonas pyrrhocoris TaxID=157538 RepID=A0A0M9G8F3_LEPPY|nr:acetyltransferase [Leptomonas pyrrhocoris]KPA84783.1 acetyltransferase [Leptomonas pyrrhocoris]|eukprot:XP_015663222.1 acetyltransferase [Leptomonas pyrrhocoris]
MPTKPACDLTFEATDDIASLTEKAKDVFIDDIFRQQLPVPPYAPVMFAKVAKAKDGRVVGGVAGTSLWNCVEISHVAVHPDFRQRGVGTALMKCIEEAARGELACNQMRVQVLSWQPRHFFEKLGYKVQWKQENLPRGHATYYLAKEWPMGFRDEPPQGYDAAATNLVVAEWDTKEATVQLDEWIRADAERHNLPDVYPRKEVTYGLKALQSDGSLAALCMYKIYWNMLYVHILTVMKGRKRRGVGSAVLRKIDEIAREHACDDVTLHTMSWQARPFYEKKNGFVCAATENDLPFTFCRYDMYHPVPRVVRSNL